MRPYRPLPLQSVSPKPWESAKGIQDLSEQMRKAGLEGLGFRGPKTHVTESIIRTSEKVGFSGYG